jgi:alpha-D-ribose 1-methylphosphonate 5-triphosphate synthase subunit PhnI
VLGPSLDYSHRILQLDVLDNAQTPGAGVPDLAETPASPSYPAVADWQRAQGLLKAHAAESNGPVEPADVPDLTRDPVMFPAPRAHRLQALARADTGGVLALGYASMRGYGLIHPTVNELRLAHAEVAARHPVTGEVFSAGRVRVSQAEVVTTGGGDHTSLTIGFAATLGWNEVKLIAASTLDMEMNQPQPHPAHTEEFVLYHTEAVEASGFCIHFKLPHYVTFASSMDNLRKVISTYYGDEAGKDAPTDDESTAPEITPTESDVQPLRQATP